MVTFQTPRYRNVSMFDQDARTMLTLMGLSTTVPGALAAEDVPAVLDHLSRAIDAQKVPTVEADNDQEHEDDQEPDVPLKVRSAPLIELLTAAAEAQSHVIWQ